MKVVFVGCVEFSRFALKALIDAKADIVGIFTIDDSLKKGVSDFACFDDLINGLNIPIFKFRDFNSKESLQTLENLNPDLMYVIGWSWLVKKQLMDVPKKGVIGLHPTLLPKGRGRAPIPWTILNGLKQSGATIFFIAEQADAGDILKQVSYPIDEDETATTLYKKVCEATYQLVSETYPKLIANREERLKQDDSLATLWIKRKPSDGLLHWSHSTKNLYTLIRAVTHPYPGAFTFLRGKKMIVWQAKPTLCPKESFAGSVVSVQNDGVVVTTGDGALLLELVQWEGDSKKAASDVLKVGDVFDPLHRVKEIAEKVVQEAKTKRKISMFSVANTANLNNPPLLLCFRPFAKPIPRLRGM
ncbi:MAG: methionyl-tRNA formyltransferase [Deltaproteobacteria bacterium]|nr:methionyl-tRNA formyltransferase [Deltaproteobacteria bacterium]